MLIVLYTRVRLCFIVLQLLRILVCTEWILLKAGYSILRKTAEFLEDYEYTIVCGDTEECAGNNPQCFISSFVGLEMELLYNILLYIFMIYRNGLFASEITNKYIYRFSIKWTFKLFGASLYS